MMSAPPSPLPPHRATTDPAPAPDLQAQVAAERARMLGAHVPTVMVAATILSLAMFLLLREHVAETKAWAWFGLRLAIVGPRIWQSRPHARADLAGPGLVMRGYRGVLLTIGLDGLIWGAAWWWLVPADRTDLIAITLTAILGVAAMAAFVLHADVRAVAWNVLPMLLPNAVYAATMDDAIGAFGAIGLLVYTVLLLLESRRAQSRLLELLNLRFMHEHVLHEREQALALAQHHSEAKSRFLASMSHEMRTPLHGILGLARLVREDEQMPLAQRRLDLLERSGEHLLNVINDVLDLAKIEAGHMQIDQQVFDLSALLDEVVGVSAVTANRKGLQLKVHSPLPPRYGVQGDAKRVRQVLHNLLGNAIKFTDEGSVTLQVLPRPGSEQICFVVQDTGGGIPEAEQAHIFDAFHQAAQPTGRRAGGTGLGLTISRQLCQAMGGDLRYVGPSGPGAAFECELCLPAATLAPAQGGDAAHPVATDCLVDRRLLLVEDNLINAMVAEAALRQLGVAVHIVDDGRKAVDWLATNEVDLVLMDCQMPVLDGVEAARQIRAREHQQGKPAVPIVALTANVFAAERQRCAEAGMDDYLGKPFHREELQRVLMRHIGQRPPQRATGMAAA